MSGCSDLPQSQNHVLLTSGDVTSLQHFVPDMSPDVQQVELCAACHGENCPKNLCYMSLKLSGHTRGLVGATCPSDINSSCYIFICVYAMRLCHYSSPICEQHMSLVVAATCHCDMPLHHDSSCAGSFKHEWLCSAYHPLIMWT